MASYTVELNIGSLTNPVRGNGWIAVNPYLNNAKIARGRAEDQIYSILQFGGTLKFKGEEYTALKDLVAADAEAQMRVKIGSTVKFNGELVLRGVYNEDEFLVDVAVKAQDEYQPILDNYDTRINIMGNTDVYTVQVDINVPVLEMSLTQFQTGDAYFFQDVNLIETLTVYARQKITLPNSVADQYLLNTDYYLISSTSTTKTIGINWDDAGYATPTFPTDWTQDGTSTPVNLNINDRAYIPNLGKFGYFVKSYFISLLGTYITYWVLEDYYTANTIEYSRYRRLDETIEYMIGEVDSSVKFDSSSFNYFDNNIELANLLINGISDTIPVNNPKEEKDVAQTVGELTLQELFTWLRDFMRIYWELEQVGSDYYFRIKHASEVLLTSGTNPDFTNYSDKNWSAGKNTYQYDAKERYNRVVRTPTAKNIDFIGADIEMPDITTETKKEVSFSTFYLDIADIYTNPSDYPDASIEQFVILSCDTATSTDYISRSATGALTGLVVTNNDLSVANIDENHGREWLSDINIIVNGASATATQRRYQNQIELDVPIDDWEEIDFTELVTTGIGDTEPLLINVDLNNGFAKYIGRI